MMPNDRSRRDEERFSASPSEEWLDRIAANEGLTRDEVLELLISGYWTMNEIFRLMQHSDESQEPGPIDANPTSPQDRAVRGEQSTEVDIDPERLGHLQDIIKQLQTSFDEPGQRQTRNPVEGTPAQSQPDRQRTAPDNPTRDEFEDLKQEVSSRYEALSVETENEFDNIQTILEYLVDSVEDLEDNVQQVREEQRTTVERLRDDWVDVAEIKREANRLDIETATCESCESTVTLHLLSTPHCPECDRRLTSVEPSSGWLWFGSPTLRVGSEGSREGGADHVLPELDDLVE